MTKGGGGGSITIELGIYIYICMFVYKNNFWSKESKREFLGTLA